MILIRSKSSGLKYLIVTLIIMFSSFNVSALDIGSQADSIIVDSVLKTKTKINIGQFAVPAALIAVGSCGVQHRFNNSLRDELVEFRGDRFLRADDYVQYVPFGLFLGLGSIGVDCSNDFKARFISGITAYLSMGIMVNITKYAVKEKRPDSDSWNSFPSGHTATVFMGAELIRQEYGPGIALCAYTVATGVAFLRMYNDRHWLNDVLAGAGIGILSARIGYWMLPLYKKWFHWNETSSIAVMPSYNSRNKSLNIGLIALF